MSRHLNFLKNNLTIYLPHDIIYNINLNREMNRSLLLGEIQTHK
jgi:hypothetical protein